MTFDNLGGNVSLGYSGGFNATYYCRTCELSRDECRLTTEDDLRKYRTKENYAVALDMIETSHEVDLQETKGIVCYCALNDLKYFHIMDNLNADIMHDLAEGSFPFLIKNVFKFCIDNNFFSSLKELRNHALFYDYGNLNSRNIPSAICYERSNLGQNASQLKCLLHHLPYILYKFKNDEKLTAVWVCVESMLQIAQIVYDSNITENDVKRLEKAVSIHLKSMIQCFDGVRLLPKHHFMIHYANTIRAVGPIVHMSTMRFEMQHKTFTTYAKRSNNFVNVSKSLASNLQSSILLTDPYQCDYTHGKSRERKNFNGNHQNILQNTFENLGQIFVTKWLHINSNYYRSGLMLKDSDTSFYQIDEILFRSGVFHFLCHEFVFVRFDSFLYSAEIREVVPIKYHIINETSLHVKRSFLKKQLDSKFYIIADCLEIPVH